jgi:Glycosyl hydrolase family 26
MAVSALAVSGCGGSSSPPMGRLVPPVSTHTCVYSGNTLVGLWDFEHLIHAQIGCVLVFADAAPNWTEWERPWFLSGRGPTEDWPRFGAQSGHSLIITINLLPGPLATGDWRAVGAAGGYIGYARRLAANLVAAGLGGATIRLGHEANGTWYPDNVGKTPLQWSQWREFWRRSVLAMRSVRGAHFQFNWCIAAGYRAIPFSDYYPGDDVVNSIGVDVYDVAAPKGANRWDYQLNRPGGVAAIASFASEHHKPLSIPEWGLAPSYSNGGGDDAGFVTGIATLARTAPLSFQSYFFANQSRTALVFGKNSLEVYDADLLNP